MQPRLLQPLFWIRRVLQFVFLIVRLYQVLDNGTRLKDVLSSQLVEHTG